VAQAGRSSSKGHALHGRQSPCSATACSALWSRNRLRPTSLGARRAADAAHQRLRLPVCSAVTAAGAPAAARRSQWLLRAPGLGGRVARPPCSGPRHAAGGGVLPEQQAVPRVQRRDLRTCRCFKQNRYLIQLS
jgi:hypothetical protein